MSLEEIKNKLYKKEADPDLATHDESEFDSRQEDVDLEKNDITTQTQIDAWQEEAPIPAEKKKKVLKIAIIVLSIIAFVAVILVAVYHIRKSLFNEENVAVSISGPTEARSGKLLTYEVVYENKNMTALNNAVLRIVHPANFKSEESTEYQDEGPTVSLVKIGTIGKKASGKISFSGRSFAPRGTLDYLKVELTYQPATFGSEFVSRQQMGVNVISTPMTIEVLAPQNMASGNALDYQISYKNVGMEDFDNIRIKVDFPEGFIFSKSEPNVSESNNVWYIGRLAAGESGKIVISGQLRGERGVMKNFKAYVGAMNQGQFVSYNEEGATTKIEDSPLSIIQVVNDSMNPYINAGEELRFEIRYKNESSLGLKNLIVTGKLDSPILDYETIKFYDGGAYDVEKQMFIWKASDHESLASLEPGQGGSIKFAIKVKDLIPINTANDKNFVVSSLVKIDSPDIPTPINMNKIVSGNRLDMKLNSKIIMQVEGYYANPYLENSGPIPPAVGKETTYVIRLKAGNVSNDVTDAKIEIVLPTGVVATGKFHPPNAPIAYNERTNQWIWNIGTMKAGEGILTPYQEAIFQIKVKPSPDQVGEVIDIVKESTFSAKDSFTKQNLIYRGGIKDIRLKEDVTIPATGWKVAP